MWNWIIAATLAASIVPAPGPDMGGVAGPSTIEGEFQQICQELYQGENVLFGSAVLGYLNHQMRQTEDPATQVKLRGRLAWELLRLNRPQEGMEVLGEAFRVAETHALPGEVMGQLTYVMALTHLQLAEDQNCVEHHTQASCVLPVRDEGRHVRPQHIRQVGDIMEGYLRQQPQDVQALWLLNLSRMLSGEYPQAVPAELRLPQETFDSATSFPRWLDIAPELGVNAFDLAGGAVMDDFDGDGLLDLVTTTMDPCGPMKAFRNDGLGGFEDVTADWGLDEQYGGLNLVQADYDNDGMLDLLVLRGAWLGDKGQIRSSLLRNDLARAGRFTDVTAQAGLARPAYPSQVGVWGDYDNDGDLDLFMGNESRMAVPYTTLLFFDVLPMAAMLPPPPPGEKPDITALFKMFQDERASFPSQLFRNNGDGTFTDVAAAAGVSNNRFAKGAAWGDYDNDGDLDLYVSNLGPNRLYRNEGDGTFTDVAPELGVTSPELISFASWFFDYDNDGDLDLYVGDYSAPYPVVTASYLQEGLTQGHAVLYRNEGGRFADVSLSAGLGRPALPMGANFGDVDNDGYPDIYMGTGVPDFDALMPNVMLRNDGGRAFEDVTFASGTGHLQKGHGVAFGDLDNDGDQDMLVQMGGAYPSDAFGNALYENPTENRSWITLRLRGTRANRFGVGARIEATVREADGTRSVHALAGSGGSFGSSSLQQEIGLGAGESIETLTVRWHGSGTVQTFEDVAVNRVYEVVEGEGEMRAVELPRLRLGGRAGVPGSPMHAHHGAASVAASDPSK